MPAAKLSGVFTPLKCLSSDVSLQERNGFQFAISRADELHWMSYKRKSDHSVRSHL